MKAIASTNHANRLSRLSVVIPARDEEGCIAATVEHLHLELTLHQVPHEIVVVDHVSSDRTWDILRGLQANNAALRLVKNDRMHGFGRAITKGLESVSGDAVVIMMADESDDCSRPRMFPPHPPAARLPEMVEPAGLLALFAAGNYQSQETGVCCQC